MDNVAVLDGGELGRQCANCRDVKFILVGLFAKRSQFTYPG